MQPLANNQSQNPPKSNNNIMCQEQRNIFDLVGLSAFPPNHLPMVIGSNIIRSVTLDVKKQSTISKSAFTSGQYCPQVSQRKKYFVLNYGPQKDVTEVKIAQDARASKPLPRI